MNRNVEQGGGHPKHSLIRRRSSPPPSPPSPSSPFPPPPPPPPPGPPPSCTHTHTRSSPTGTTGAAAGACEAGWCEGLLVAGGGAASVATGRSATVLLPLPRREPRAFAAARPGHPRCWRWSRAFILLPVLVCAAWTVFCVCACAHTRGGCVRGGVAWGCCPPSFSGLNKQEGRCVRSSRGLLARRQMQLRMSALAVPSSPINSKLQRGCEQRSSSTPALTPFVPAAHRTSWRHAVHAVPGAPLGESQSRSLLGFFFGPRREHLSVSATSTTPLSPTAARSRRSTSAGQRNAFGAAPPPLPPPGPGGGSAQNERHPARRGPDAAGAVAGALRPQLAPQVLLGGWCAVVWYAGGTEPRPPGTQAGRQGRLQRSSLP